MNNKRPHEWVGPNHKDNVLNGALIVAIKVGLLLALLEGTAPFQLPPRSRQAPRFPRRPSRYFGRGLSSFASGCESFPARRSATAAATARATLRTSSCTAVSRSSSSWLVA